MKRRAHRVAAIATSLMLAVPGLAPRATAQLPDTPAGRQYVAWRKAQESGDSATMQQFIEKYMPWGRVQQELMIARRSGGYEFKRVEESDPTHIVVLAQERGPARQFARITLNVAAAEPNAITGIGIATVDPPAEFAPPKLTTREIKAARNGAPFRQFSAWLEAFNSGDRERISNFLRANFPSRNVDAEMNFRSQRDGFDVRALEQASPTTASGLLQARASDDFARFLIEVEATEPHQISRLQLRPVPRPAEFAMAPMSEAELVAALREKLEKDVAADRFAGTVIIARLGASGTPKELYSGAHGQADRDRKIPNTLETRFRIGSMNKMFTATSILQLVQAGKIKLTDPLGNYLTDYPNKDLASKVTIHHLLTHTGGTGDIFGPDYAAHRLELKTLQDYVNLYGQRATLYEPGSRWMYSNYGMLLLGVVIERVSGKSYYDYVAEHIYKPAGMTRSGSEPESESVSERSTGYMRAPGGSSWTPNTNTLPYRGTSAGGGYSTVGDLLKFASALMGHRLLNAEHTQMLITGKVNAAGGRMYAYGFEDGRPSGAGFVGHGGGAPGMNGELRIYPKTGYVVAVLSNLDPPAATQVWNFVDLRLPK